MIQTNWKTADGIDQRSWLALRAEPLRRAIVARPTPGLPDWFRLEWVEHDNCRRDEFVSPGVSRLYLSARLDPYACCEGTRGQFRELAQAVLRGRQVRFSHCGAIPWGEKAFAFYSPGNSDYVVLVHAQDAQEWARSFLQEEP